MNPLPQTSSKLLERYQRFFMLLLMGILLFLVIAVSTVIFRQQSKYLHDAFYRKGTASLQHIQTICHETLISPRKPDLTPLLQIAQSTDDDIEAVAFFDPTGKLVASSVGDIPLPVEADHIGSVVNTRDYTEGQSWIMLAPVKTEKGDLQGLAYLKISKRRIGKLAMWAAAKMDATILFVFIILGFLLNRLLTKVSRLAQKEAEASAELAKAYEELKSLQEQLIQAEKMSALGKLASSVGHELRNPLGAIKNSVYYIRDVLVSMKVTDEDPTLVEFLDLIDKEIKSSIHIISDILEYSKVVKINRHPTDVNDLLQFVQKTLLEVPSKVTIKHEFDPALPKAIIDEERMKQVFSNIMINACLAMPSGGTLTIRTHVEQVDAQSKPGIQNSTSRTKKPWIFVDFTDTGCGMTPDVMEKIFEPLFTTRAKGTGLGLPISLGIIRAHSGNIAVSSEPQKGTQFTVQFPIEENVYGSGRANESE